MGLSTFLGHQTTVNRYYLPHLQQADGVTLDRDEARHLAVAHDGLGSTVVLFDGQGHEAEARVVELGKKRAVVDVGPVREVSRELPVRVVLGSAMPKAQRQHLLVEKATELGVARLVPLACRRSVVTFNKKSKVGKFDQFAVEACKQCGRNRVPQIDPMVDFPSFVHEVPEQGDLKLILSTDPSSRPLARCLPEGPCPSIVAAVGPEGGFTDDEVDLACRAGFEPVSLGRSVLRIETACMALLAQVGAVLEGGDSPRGG